MISHVTRWLWWTPTYGHRFWRLKSGATTALHSAVCAERPKHRISEKRMVAARNVSKVCEQWSFRWRKGELRRSLQKQIMKSIQVPFLNNKMSIFFTLLNVFSSISYLRFQNKSLSLFCLQHPEFASWLIQKLRQGSKSWPKIHTSRYPNMMGLFKQMYRNGPQKWQTVLVSMLNFGGEVYIFLKWTYLIRIWWLEDEFPFGRLGLYSTTSFRQGIIIVNFLGIPFPYSIKFNGSVSVSRTSLTCCP